MVKRQVEKRFVLRSPSFAGAALASLFFATLPVAAGQLIPGTLDAATGVFTPLPAARSEAAAAAPLVIEGSITIVTTFNTSLPPGTTIEGGGGFSVISGQFSHEVHGDAVVTRNGAKGSATLKIPYVLAAASGSAKMVVTAWVGANTSLGQFAQFKRTIPLPANSAAITVSFNASL